MSDEIIKQTPGFTIYRTADWGPPIPYPSVARSESVNHGFFDLRDHPELAAKIPEAMRSKGLQSILRVLNAPRSPFMSLGCEYVLNARDGSKDGFPCYIHSYTDLTYREPKLHSCEEQMLHLAERFYRQIEGTVRSVYSIEVGIQRMKHFFGDPGYNLHLGLSGYGATEEVAAGCYEKVAEATARAFAELSQVEPA